MSEIPEDAEMAETFYSQFEDEFEDSESDKEEDDYSALMDHMQDALDQSASGVDRTLSEESVSEGLTDTLKQRRIEALRAYPLILHYLENLTGPRCTSNHVCACVHAA